jgi:glycosyltransferase domain-containing protein
MTLLNRLTIFIPTYNRPLFLQRSMQFWGNIDVNILVIDGSTQSFSDLYKTIIPSNIKYIHSPTTLSHRIKMAVCEVATEYVVMLSDDEFFIPSALESALKFLEDNPEYIACGGQCISFKNFNKNELKYRLSYPELNKLDLNKDIASQRVISHFENYTCAHVASVMRAPIWKQAMYPWTVFDYNAYATGELAFEFIASYLGKSKILSNLYWFRSSENGSNISDEKSTNPANTFNAWWNQNRFRLEREIFFDKIYEALNLCTRDELINIAETYQVAFHKYYLRFIKVKWGNMLRTRLLRISFLERLKFALFNEPYPNKNLLEISLYCDSVKIREILESNSIEVDKVYFTQINEIISKFHS